MARNSLQSVIPGVVGRRRAWLALGTLALVAELGDGARAASATEAAAAGDLVVVTIPLMNYREVPVEPLAGKIVIDTNNYYWQRDGHIAELDAAQTTSAGLLQAHLPTSRVVKAFNNIVWTSLATEGTPTGTADRRALAISGDDDEAKSTVAGLIDRFGFDVVDAGPLSESWRFEPGAPAYGPRMDGTELASALAAAKRVVEVS